MRFRPCIDIHNGKVKQIVGGSLTDVGNAAVDNFVADQDGAFFANMYKEAGLSGGHIILLNPPGSEFYEADLEQAKLALDAYPGNLQIGGGINAENAKKFLDMGASHVIVTSYVFKNGEVNFANLDKLVEAVGKEKIVIDLSCRKRDGDYYIVTDRWQSFTNVKLNEKTLDTFAAYCDEYLVHAVDVEGKASGIEEDVAKLLGSWGKLPATYAGGVSSFEDLEKLKDLGQNKIDVTIGSALDIFGGNLKYKDVINFMEGKYEKV